MVRSPLCYLALPPLAAYRPHPVVAQSHQIWCSMRLNNEFTRYASVACQLRDCLRGRSHARKDNVVIAP